MTPEEITNQARELDPSFDERRHPLRVAINFLSRLQRRLVGEWVKHEDVPFVEVFTATFPLTDFSSGVDILEDEPESGESVADPLAVTKWFPQGDLFIDGQTLPADIELITWGDRNRRQYDRAAYIRENTLFFTGREEDYTDVARAEFTYVPTPADILTKDEELLLPLSSEDVLVNAVGAFFAKRSKQEELARSRREYVLEANDAETLWIDELKRKRGATVSRTTEAW